MVAVNALGVNHLWACLSPPTPLTRLSTVARHHIAVPSSLGTEETVDKCLTFI